LVSQSLEEAELGVEEEEEEADEEDLNMYLY
jgi:hypothetical protein